jgi:hypothetical protein
VGLDFDKGIARIPWWIVGLGVAGTGAAAWKGGWPYAGAFFVGAGAAYFNFRLLERVVNRLGQLVAARPGKLPRAPGLRMFIQIALFVVGAFVILHLSGFNVVWAFSGFLVCPAAVILEIVYELLTYDS